MRWLLFLSRLAFICGFFLLLTISLIVMKWAQDDSLTSTIIIIGYFMSLVILPVTNLCYMLVLIINRGLKEKVPLWLVISNILFLMLLLFYIFYLNDPYYHQK